MPRSFFESFDYILLATVAILIILGILILASVSAPLSQREFSTPFYYLKHQIFFGLIPGLILAILAFKIPLSFLKKWALVFFFLNLILMLMVFLPKVGSAFSGAKRWLNFGPITFQPAEFLKLSFIFYLAAWLSSKKEKSLIAFLVIISLVSLLLIFQPDISTLGIITLISILLYFLAKTPLWHSILIISLTAGSLLALIKFASYRLARVLVFLKPETDPLGIGYQIKQALIAVGSGGIFGLGLGMGKQKFGFLPHPISDSIFALFSEETGFLGGLVLISFFLIFFWRGFKIGKSSKEKFFQYLALGITFWITIQAFVNIGSMIGILPLAGIPLPFISYGGSALIAELIGIGILLNISKSC
jgi:cell division protein FtsW